MQVCKQRAVSPVVHIVIRYDEGGPLMSILCRPALQHGLLDLL